MGMREVSTFAARAATSAGELPAMLYPPGSPVKAALGGGVSDSREDGTCKQTCISWCHTIGGLPLEGDPPMLSLAVSSLALQAAWTLALIWQNVDCG
jgi:hypothetical protein